MLVTSSGNSLKDRVSNEDHLDGINDPAPKAERKGNVIQDLCVSSCARGINVHGTK